MANLEEECIYEFEGAKDMTFGNSRASCNKCSFISGYWECGHDLEHDCEEWTVSD